MFREFAIRAEIDTNEQMNCLDAVFCLQSEASCLQWSFFFYLQLTVLAFLLTVVAFLLTVGAFLLTVP